MPLVDIRRAIIRNSSSIFVLFTLLCLLPSVTAEHRYDAIVQSLPPSSTGNFRDATAPTKFMIIERQLLSNVITLPLPLPTPISFPTNQNPLPNGSPIPLLISPYIPSPSSSSPSSSVSLSRTSSSGLLIASKTSASAQFSPSPNSNATTNNVNGSNRLTAINFLPFIILTSFFVISLMGWCLHGWCTRRPKENLVTVGTKESRKRRRGWFWNRRGGRGEENHELVCGPAYVSFVGQDVEEFATVRQPGRYRWPTLPETNQDRHQRKRDDENPGFVPFEFTGIAGQTVRPVPSAAAAPPRGPNVGKKLSSPTTTAGPMSPTSIALRDLYDVVLRSEYDGLGAGEAEERTSLLGVGSGVLNANRSTSGRKRKGHVRQKSESRDEPTELLDLGGRWRGILSDDDSDLLPLKKLEVRNPSVGEGRLGLREEGDGDGIPDEEDYTPLPTPTRIQFSVGRKARANAMPNSEYLPFSPSKDVLPAHPRQIMSPPLENQFYFLPLPTTAELSDIRNDGPVVGLATSPGRVRGSVRPKVSTSREKFGERNDPNGAQNHFGDVDDRPSFATTSPLRTAPREVKTERRNTSSRSGASKGKGKLVKAKSSAKRQTGEE